MTTIRNWAERQHSRQQSEHKKKPTKHELFEAVELLCRSLGGWVISVPGLRTITIECLSSSPIPTVLGDMGFVLHLMGGGSRLIPGGHVEHVVDHAPRIVGRPQSYDVLHPGHVATLLFGLTLSK
jgi:hypothetical protein